MTIEPPRLALPCRRGIAGLGAAEARARLRELRDQDNFRMIVSAKFSMWRFLSSRLERSPNANLNG